jgi:hypothetical protein
MKLYQLANDVAAYDHRALWWLVVTDDLEDELAGPFPTQQQAEDWIIVHGHPDESLPAMLLGCVCALMLATAIAIASLP